jgi:hypothetical protein
VRDVNIGHDPVIVADDCRAFADLCAAIDRAVLADNVSVTDNQFGRLAAVFLILRNVA